MKASLSLLAHQHKLALFRRQPRFKDRALIALRGGNAELRGIAIEKIGGDRIARDYDAIELAPRERLDRARLFRSRAPLERADILLRDLLQPDPADHLFDRWRRDRRRGERWWRLLGNLARRIGRGEATIGAVEIIVLGMRGVRAWHGRSHGSDQSEHKAKRETAQHGRHHSAASIARLLTLGTALTLAACGEYDSLKGMHSTDEIDWPAKVEQYSQPGPLGTLFNRKPPAVSIRNSGPYPGPLSEPVPPIIAPEIADVVVAAPLRVALNAEARMNLATASMLAATATTGTPVSWKSADANGAVVPARDAYLSHHGLICRDLRQQVQKSDQSLIEQVTLCHEDIGDSHFLWLPGSPD
jgi:surface antigen